MIHLQQVCLTIAGLGAELLFENGWWPNNFKRLVAENLS
jgi:hypothetical protein